MYQVPPTRPQWGYTPPPVQPRKSWTTKHTLLAVGAGGVVLLSIAAGVVSYSHHSSGGGVSAAVCSQALGDLSGVSTAVGYQETQQVWQMSDDAFNAVQDDGADGSKLANDRMVIDGRRKTLGQRRTPEEAHALYVAAQDAATGNAS